jgi:hypothetical protein
LEYHVKSIDQISKANHSKRAAILSQKLQNEKAALTA